MEADVLEDFLLIFTASRFEHIDKYALKKVLGHGGFGVVFLYKLKEHHDWLPVHVAVKQLHQDIQEAIEAKKKLLMARETNIHSALQHPNILECYGYCIVNDAFCLVLKYCRTDPAKEGADLAKFVKYHTPEKRVAKDQARCILQQLSSGLDYLRHQGEHGVVHRDLKPENILVMSKDPLRVAISDFGLAKIIISCNSKLTQGIGTERYIAPEVLDDGQDLRQSNAGDMGHAGDVYSLGVIGFEIVTGILLPEATSEAEVMAVFDKHKDVIEDGPLIDLLQSCLRWNPEERIRKNELLHHDYFALPRGLWDVKGRKAMPKQLLVEKIWRNTLLSIGIPSFAEKNLPEITTKVKVFVTHLIGKQHLICGHTDGFLCLIDLDRMEFVTKMEEHTKTILCIASNSKYALCGSEDGDASLWKTPTEESAELSLMQKMTMPLNGEKIWCCSMNQSHMAIGTSGRVNVYKIGEGLQKVDTISMCKPSCGPMSFQFLEPAGNSLLASNNNDVILYENGEQRRKVSIGEQVQCISTSAKGHRVWLGTGNGHLFCWDATSDQVKRTPLHMEGQDIRQVAEADGGRKLVIKSSTNNKMTNSFLTVVSTEDWDEQEKLFQHKQYISFFSIMNDILVLGEWSKVKFIPIPAILSKETREATDTRALDQFKILLEGSSFYEHLKSLLSWKTEENVKEMQLLQHGNSDLPRGLWHFRGDKTVAEPSVLQRVWRFVTSSLGVPSFQEDKTRIFITHLISKQHLICGHSDGSLSLIDLNLMEIVTDERTHNKRVHCISSNSKFILCGSEDGDASLWKIPAEESPAELNITGKMTQPLAGQPLWCSSINEDHLVIATPGMVRIYTADVSPSPVATINTCIGSCGPKSCHMLQPNGSGFWANNDEDIILYGDGKAKQSLHIADVVVCLSRSATGESIWLGTWNGSLFNCDTTSGQVTRTPLYLEGEGINQIEEVNGGKMLIIKSSKDNDMQSSYLTLVTTGDFRMRRLLTKRQCISFFSIISDVVVFGEYKKVKFIPISEEQAPTSEST